VESEMELESRTSGSTPRQVVNPLEKAGHVCFVCFDRPRHEKYAIQVPCLQTKHSREVLCYVTRRSVSSADGFAPSGKSSPVYRPLEDWEKFAEDDRAVYIRMVEACVQDLGRWKKWLPYYGVASVTEADVGALSPCVPVSDLPNI
jgi:hypothetical protein